MDPKRDEIEAALTRLAARGGSELGAGQPHWGDAILCDGLTYAARALGSRAPLAEALRWFAPKLATGPNTGAWIWFWSAQALPALDLHLATGEAGYLDYARAVLAALESKAARTRTGAIIPHPPAVEVWVDITYFSAPAMARLGRILGDAAMVERALDQLLVHRDHLLDQSSGLMWHVAYPDKHSHSPCLWARGNSWFAIAAPEVMAEVRKAALADRLESKMGAVAEALGRQLAAVIDLQDAGGLWHTVIDRPDSYLETSASAGFALGLGRVLREGLADLDRDRGAQAYARALRAVCASIDSQGDLTGVSQQTPPGDFNFYQSIEVGTAPFGAGVGLMALAESLAG